MPASLIILMPARMRHRDYGSKEKLFSIDKNIFWWIESDSWQPRLGRSLTANEKRGSAMTAIHGYIQPSRRPGELGIHSVDHFHFAASMSVSAATV
jgi:hypothetical protein